MGSQAMPWFLTKLREDYRRWAAGLDRRMAVGNGEMQALAAQAAKGGAAALPPGVEELPLVGTDAASAEIEPPEVASAKPKGFGGAART